MTCIQSLRGYECVGQEGQLISIQLPLWIRVNYVVITRVQLTTAAFLVYCFGRIWHIGMVSVCVKLDEYKIKVCHCRYDCHCKFMIIFVNNFRMLTFYPHTKTAYS